MSLQLRSKCRAGAMIQGLACFESVVVQPGNCLGNKRIVLKGGWHLDCPVPGGRKISRCGDGRADDKLLPLRHLVAAYLRLDFDRQWRRSNKVATDNRQPTERRLGEMMTEQPKAQGQRTDLGFRKTRVATLSEAGIDKNLAHRAFIPATTP